MTDWYADYYRQSRGYNWHDLMEMRQQKPRTDLPVPDCFKHQFADRAAYDAWVEEKRRNYFG